MCGVVGFQGDFPLDLLPQMTAAVAHRGPDGEGMTVCRVEGAPLTGLGHRRLAIIDLSKAGHQPMTVEADCGGGRTQLGLTLVFNGEIYNYKELRAELLADGHRFRTATDSEVLLHLYERDGFGMLQKLNGIFAFAIHDGREHGRPDGVDRGSLFLARDHLGVKPLYYAETDAGFLFASEIKALLSYRQLSRSIDSVALHYMLAYLWTPAPRTMLHGVRKLEPGTAMVVQDGRVRRSWTYYDVPYDGTRDERDERELAGELADEVLRAVRRQLVADVPIGAFLSGGLDSSAVVAMMRRVLPAQPITCFSIGFAGDAADGSPADLPYARRVAQHLNVDLHEIVVRPDAIGRLEEMIYLLDEPQADPAPINALIISEQARAMGIPVLLSGAGGDDLFSGYRRHLALHMERWWRWLPKGVRSQMQAVAAAAAHGKFGGQSVASLRRLVKMFSYAGESGDRRLVSYFWWSTGSARRSLYTRDFSLQVSDLDESAPLQESLDAIPREHEPLQRMLYLETKHFLADHNLNYTDRAGMAAGVEVRVPLLDIDLVHLATRVPAHMKQRGRTGKWLFKKAMEPYLPREIIYRPKTGFGAPLRRWLRHELREHVEDTLAASTVRKRGLFDPAAVKTLLDSDRSGAVDGAYTIFALMCFELWCRRFVDG